MKGTMMQLPLVIPQLLERVGAYFPEQEVVSRLGDGSLHRYTYGDFHARTRRLASALQASGIRPGDRVGTLSWNHYRHLEAYLAIPCMGGVLHTLNLRLFPEQIAYIANHAGDRLIFVDESLLGLLDQFLAETPSVEQVVVMGATAGKWKGRRKGFVDYETFLARGKKTFEYPKIGEQDAAGMCYTSGTTGEPKGVVYTHRSTCLHSLGTCLTDGVGVGMRETVLAVVPMFHANAWGLPYACVMTGAKQVFPGPDLSPAAVLDLIGREGVTLAAGVPTIWGGVLELLDSKPGKYKIDRLKTLISGGSTVPRYQIEGFERRHGVRLLQLWGMTETSPMGTVGRVKPTLPQEPGAAHFEVRGKQGIPAPFVELKVVDDKGKEVARDGKRFGDLLVRGPWVAAGYYKNPKATRAAQVDGWFKTGDVVTIDPHGYMKITDRTKDLIKSGGEWISSVDLETTLMAHPDVLEACVIAVPHPKWDERPMAFVVRKPGSAVDDAALATHLGEHFAKWQLPDGYAFVDAIPKTSVGKFDKKVLRARVAEGKAG